MAAKTFLHFFVPEDLLEKIEEFRFNNRFRSRSAAILWLVESGLKNGSKPPKSALQHPRASMKA